MTVNLRGFNVLAEICGIFLVCLVFSAHFYSRSAQSRMSISYLVTDCLRLV